MFYTEQAKWKPETPPIESFYPPAMLDNQGIIHLQHRVGANVGNDYAMIRICVDREVIYFDKAKYSEASAIGVTYNSGTFYIEKLHKKAWYQTSQ